MLYQSKFSLIFDQLEKLIRKLMKIKNYFHHLSYIVSVK